MPAWALSILILTLLIFVSSLISWCLLLSIGCRRRRRLSQLPLKEMPLIDIVIPLLLLAQLYRTIDLCISKTSNYFCSFIIVIGC